MAGPDQLTSFTERTVRQVAVSPLDGTIALSADRDGDEFHQLYLLDPDEGWPEQITDVADVQHFIGFGAFSPDGTRLAYGAQSDTDVEVRIRDLATGDTRTVFGEGMFAVSFDWSPDGTKLLAVDLRHNSDQSIHLIDLESGEAPEITPHAEDGLYIPGPWAADGSGFYLLSDEGREFRGLAFYDLAAGRFEWVETPDADIEEVALSRATAGRSPGSSTSTAGSDLKLRDLESGEDLPDPELPAGARPHLTGFRPPVALSHDGSQVAVILSGPRRPPEVWVAEMGAAGARTVTESRIGVPPRTSSSTSSSSRTRPSTGVTSLPGSIARTSRGGSRWCSPSTAARRRRSIRSTTRSTNTCSAGASPSWQPTSAARPVTERRYQRLVQRDWGGGDMKDWEHAVKWLHAQEWVDPDRIGVFGGSYGGFAVLTCVTRLPDYWAVAVDIFGPSNLITAAKAVPPTWRRMMKRFMGDPDEDADLLRERSPMTYIENTKTPLLVIQGAKDPRVVKGESDQLVEKLRTLGREVEYVVFEDEGHGFTKRQNEVRAMKLSADFLERHLTS